METPSAIVALIYVEFIYTYRSCKSTNPTQYPYTKKTIWYELLFRNLDSIFMKLDETYYQWLVLNSNS